jgi:hypothetical protein
MTKTAWELWFDDAFLVERIKQQEHYTLQKVVSSLVMLLFEDFLHYL